MLPKLKVLYLCTGNSCRSQMAEGWTRHLHADSIEPYSAGTDIKRLDPRAVAVMAERSLDISTQHPKPVGTLMDIPFDFVITVCGSAHEQCPLFPGKTEVIHVGFEDPPALARGAATEEEALAPYRRVRDEIREFVRTLPQFLASQPRTKGAA